MKVLPLVGTQLRSAIIGMVAGDACIRKQRFCRSVSLRITHSEKQREYLEYKREILQNLFKEWEIPIRPVNSSGYLGVKLETRTHPKLRAIRKWFYSDGRKRFSRRTLEYLTPIGIALWYMDDGSLSYKKREGKVHGREIHLNTYCSLEEARVIQAYFKEVWDVSWTVVPTKGLFRLRMGSNEAIKFFTIINPYIIPSMKYKVDLQYIRQHNQERPATFYGKVDKIVRPYVKT